MMHSPQNAVIVTFDYNLRNDFMSILLRFKFKYININEILLFCDLLYEEFKFKLYLKCIEKIISATLKFMTFLLLNYTLFCSIKTSVDCRRHRV